MSMRTHASEGGAVNTKEVQWHGRPSSGRVQLDLNSSEQSDDLPSLEARQLLGRDSGRV